MERDDALHMHPVVELVLRRKLQQADQRVRRQGKRVGRCGRFRRDEVEPGHVQSDADQLAALVEHRAAGAPHAHLCINQTERRRFAPDAGKHRFELSAIGGNFKKQAAFPDVQRTRHAFHFNPLTVLAARAEFRPRYRRRHGQRRAAENLDARLRHDRRVIAGGTHTA